MAWIVERPFMASNWKGKHNGDRDFWGAMRVCSVIQSTAQKKAILWTGHKWGRGFAAVVNNLTEGSR